MYGLITVVSFSVSLYFSLFTSPSLPPYQLKSKCSWQVKTYLENCQNKHNIQYTYIYVYKHTHKHTYTQRQIYTYS